MNTTEATPGTRTFETMAAARVTRRYRYLNGAPLNDARFDLTEVSAFRSFLR